MREAPRRGHRQNAKPKLHAEWLRPGLVGRERYLRGEEDLRHATLMDFRDAEGGVDIDEHST